MLVSTAVTVRLLGPMADGFFHLLDGFGWAMVGQAAGDLIKGRGGERGGCFQKDAVAGINDFEFLAWVPVVQGPDWLGDNDLTFT